MRSVRSLANDVTQKMSRKSLGLPERDLLVGRYEITSSIDRGDVAELFAAYDHQLERVVAIKQPRDDVPGETITSDRLRREALALATIESPHVVAIYDIGIADRGVFLVMQRLCGRTLEDEVARGGPFTPARACRVARDVLAGLSAIHASGLIHRDLKASSVLLDRDDRAVLLDLGAAMQPRKRAQGTPATTVAMAPLDPTIEAVDPGADPTPAPPVPSTDRSAMRSTELALDPIEHGPLDARVDLCQLGLLMIYLVTGVMAKRVLDPSKLSLPLPLREVVLRAVAPAGGRYTSTAQMLHAIELLLASGTLEPLPTLPPKKTRRWPEPIQS